MELLTTKEKKKINNLKKLIATQVKIREKLMVRETVIKQQIEKTITHERLLYNDVYKIHDRANKRCKHQNGTYRQRNWRDDTTYKFRIRCNDCHEVLDHEEYNYGHY